MTSWKQYLPDTGLVPMALTETGAASMRGTNIGLSQMGSPDREGDVDTGSPT